MSLHVAPFSELTDFSLMDDTPWTVMLPTLIVLHSFFFGFFFVQACTVTVIAVYYAALDVPTMVPVGYRSLKLQHT
jgi:hypothetical protein